MRLSASQTNRAPLEKLRHMFGGGIHERTRKGSLGNKPLWVWTATGRGAIAAFACMRPHFVGQDRVRKYDCLSDKIEYDEWSKSVGNRES